MRGKIFVPVDCKSPVIDLAVYPRVDNVEQNGKIIEYTVGDLHGNPLKLLHYLLKFGFVSFPKSSYNELLNAIKNYRHIASITAKVGLVYGFIFAIKSGLRVINKTNLFQCLGDMFADRCPVPDIFMSTIIDSVVSQGMRIQILLSNHDMILLHYICGKVINCRMQTTSLDLLDEIALNEGVGFVAEFDMQIINSVLPNLKLVSCSVSSDHGLSIFSHAPIDLDVIAYLAEVFFIKADVSTPAALVRTVFGINCKFRELILRPELRGLKKFLRYVAQSEKQSCRDDAIQKVEYPIFFTLWNREVENSSRCAEVKAVRVKSIKGVPLDWYHGHERRDSIMGSMDDLLGKYHKSFGDNYTWLQGRGVYLSCEDMTVGVCPILLSLQVGNANPILATANYQVKKLMYRFAIVKLIADNPEEFHDHNRLSAQLYEKCVLDEAAILYFSPQQQKHVINMKYIFISAYCNVGNYLLRRVFFSFTRSKIHDLICRALNHESPIKLSCSEASVSRVVANLFSGNVNPQSSNSSSTDQLCICPI